MGVKKSVYLATFIIVAVLAASAFAADQGATTGSKEPAAHPGNYLAARTQHLSCTIDFTTTVMNDVVGALPQGSGALSADITQLNGDKSQLSSLSSAGDPAAFDSFVDGTLTQDVKRSISDLHSAREGYKKENSTNETITQLKGEYDAAHATLSTCNSGAVSTLLQTRIEQFTKVISDWNGRISTLSQKGFDTTAMQSVASGATADVVAPLQAAFQSGDNAQMKAALQTYCLGDECNGDKNASAQPYDYHGYAHMALETLQSELNKAETDPLVASLTAAGVQINSSTLDDAKQQLDSVRGALSAVGTAKYTAGQAQAIGKGLKQASQDIERYARSVREGVRQHRNTERGNKTASSSGAGNRNIFNRTENRSGNGSGNPFNHSGNSTRNYSENHSTVGGYPFNRTGNHTEPAG